MTKAILRLLVPLEFTKLSDLRIRKPPDMHLRECRGVPVTFRFNGHQGYDYVIVGKNMHLGAKIPPQSAKVRWKKPTTSSWPL